MPRDANCRSTCQASGLQLHRANHQPDMKFLFRSLLTYCLLTGQMCAFALIPPSEDVELPPSERVSLVHHACESRFGVSAKEVRAWRRTGADAPSELSASVTCRESSSAKALPTGFRLECEQSSRGWKCDAPDLYVLVPTDVGVVHVFPWKVSKQRAIEAAQVVARIDFMDVEGFGKIPIRNSLRNGADYVTVRKGRTSDEVVIWFDDVQMGLSFRCKGKQCPRVVWTGRTYP